MICRIVRLNAENGEESILYKNLLNKLGNQLVAYKAHVISRTPTFKSWAEKNNINRRDKNGEFLMQDVLKYFKDIDVKYEPERDPITKEEVVKLLRSYFPNALDDEFKFLTHAAFQKLAGNDDVLAQYRDGIIYLEEDGEATVDKMSTYHEMLHKFLNEFVTKDELKTLKRALAREFPQVSSELSMEAFDELMADLYIKFKAGLYKPKSTWLERFFNMLRRVFGFYKANIKTISQLFEAIESGQLYQRAMAGSDSYVTRNMMRLKTTFKTVENYKFGVTFIKNYIKEYTSQGIGVDYVVGGFRGDKVIMYGYSDGKINMAIKRSVPAARLKVQSLWKPKTEDKEAPKLEELIKKHSSNPDKVQSLKDRKEKNILLGSVVRDFGYPCTTNELKLHIRNSVLEDLKQADLSIKKTTEKIEKFPENPDIEELNKKLNTYKEGRDKILLLLQNFEGLWKDIFPNWRLADLDSDLIDEIIQNPDQSFEFLEDVNINEYGDADLQDSERSVTDNIKTFLSIISRDDGTYLDWRSAYLQMLRLCNGVDFSLDNVETQLKRNLAKILKIGVREIDLQAKRDEYVIMRHLLGVIAEAESTRIGDGKTRLSGKGRFFHSADTRNIDFFVYNENEKIIDSPSKSELGQNQSNVIIKRNGRSTEEFINEIMERTELSKEELFTLFHRETKRNMLNEIITHFASQYEKDLKIVEVERSFGARTIRYITGKTSKATRSMKSTIQRNIANRITTSKEATNMAEIFKSIVEDKSISSSEKVKRFLTTIGMSEYSTVIDRVNHEYSNIIENLGYFIGRLLELRDNKLAKLELENSAEIENTNIERETIGSTEDSEENIQEIDVEMWVKDAAASMLDDLAEALTSNKTIQRAQFQTSADGKKRYLWSPFHWAEKIISWATEGLQVNFPEYVKQTYYQNNPIIRFMKENNPVMKVYKFIYHDGIKYTSTTSNDHAVGYTKEKFEDFTTRTFLAGFLSRINSSSSKALSYFQFMYTPSDREQIFGAEMKVIDTKRAKEAIKGIIEQMKTRQKQFVNSDPGKEDVVVKVKFYDPDKVTHFTILWDAVAKTDPDRCYLDSTGAYCIKDLQNLEITEELLNNVYDQFKKMAEETTEKFLRTEIELDNMTHAIKGSNNELQDLVDKTIYPNWKLTDLLDKASQTTKSKKSWTDMGISYQEAIAQGLDREYIITKAQLEPLIHLFLVNHYLNGYALTDLVAGDQAFQKNGLTSVKRFAGLYSPRLVGSIGKFGARKKFRIGVLDSPQIMSQDKDNPSKGDIIEMLYRFLPKEVADKKIKDFGKDYDPADSQGVMLPERAEELAYSYGTNYHIGRVFKPVIYMIDKLGIPRFVKYSSIVLSDDLCHTNGKPNELFKLRENMRKNKLSELVFATAVKVGEPVRKIDHKKILTEDLIVDEASVIEVESKYYGMQFNPMHKYGSNIVTAPTQLTYFLNVLQKNVGKADKVYKTFANLIRTNLDVLKEEIKEGDQKKNIEEYVLKNLHGEGNDIMREYMDEGLGINFPSITDKAVIQLVSGMTKSAIKTKFSGGKFVLQSDYGRKKPDGTRLEYVKSPNGGAYAECVVPQGLLDPEVEKEIKKALNDGTPVPDLYLNADLLGFRLPSSELHSAIAIKVVGFYDAKGTNVIIAPRQLTPLHGSDFDVDALFVISREKVSKYGDPVGCTYNKTTKKYDFDYDLDVSKLNLKAKRAYYKNTILELFLDTITTEDNADRMFNPISMDYLHQQVKDIENLIGKKLLKELDLSKYLDNFEAFRSAFNGAASVGIVAQGIKALAYSIRASASKSTPTILIDEKEKILINGVGYYQLQDTEFVWKYLDSYINAAIDNVKEGILPVFNLNPDTMPAFITMIATGVGMENGELDTIHRFFVQPVIQLVTDTKGTKALPNYVKVAKIVNKKLQKAKAGKLEESSKPITLDKDSLIDSLKEGYNINDLLKKDNLSEKEISWLEYQAKVLEAYTLYSNIGKDLSDLARYMNIIRDLPVFKDQLDDIEEIEVSIFETSSDGKRNFSKLKSSFKLDVTELFSQNPHIKAAREVKDTITELIEMNFFKHRKTLYEFVKKVFNPDNLNMHFDTGNKDLLQKRGEVMKFLMSSVEWDSEFKGWDSVSEYEDSNGRLLRGQHAFTQHFAQKVEAVKAYLTSRAAKGGFVENSNEFVDSLSVESRRFGMTVRFATVNNLKTTEYYLLREGFEKLQNLDVKYDKNTKKYIVTEKEFPEGYTDFQRDFVRYGILQFGLGFGSMNYSMTLPPSLYKPFNDAMENKLDYLTSSPTALENVVRRFTVETALNNIELVDEFFEKPEYNSVQVDGQNVKTLSGEANGVHYNMKFVNPKKAPLIIRKNLRKREDRKDQNVLFIRLNDPDSEIVYYKKLGKGNYVDIYTLNDKTLSKDIDIYEQFKPQLKNYRVKRFGDPIEKSNLKVGDLAVVSEFSDPIMDKAKYVKIIEISPIGAKYETTDVAEIPDVPPDPKLRASRNFLLAVLEQLEKRFGISWKENNRIKSLGKFVDGEVFINFMKANLSTPFHEFAHPFVETIEVRNPEAFENLKKEILKEENKEILETVIKREQERIKDEKEEVEKEVKELENELNNFIAKTEEDEIKKKDLEKKLRRAKKKLEIRTVTSQDPDIIKEAIVEAVGRLAARHYSVMTNKPLLSALKRFIEKIANLLKRITGKVVKVEDLEAGEVTLEYLAALMTSQEDFTIELNKVEGEFHQAEDPEEEWEVPIIEEEINGRKITRESEYYENKTTKERLNRVTSIYDGFMSLFSSSFKNLDPTKTSAQRKADKHWNGLPHEHKLNIDHNGLETYDEYLTRETEWNEAGRVKGKIFSKLMEKFAAKDPDKITKIEDDIEDLYQQVPKIEPGFYDWAFKDAKTILANLGIFPNAEKDPDILTSEKFVMNKTLGFAGKLDMLAKHSDGSHTILEFKTGSKFDRKFTNSLMNYGDQIIGITNNQWERAKLQVTLYAVMLRLQDPEMKFRDLKVAWIQNRHFVGRANNGASVEIDSYLSMIETFLKDKIAQKKAGFSEEKIKEIEKMLKDNPTLFDREYYSYNTSRTLAEELLNEPDKNKLYLKKLTRIREIEAAIQYKKSQWGTKRSDSELMNAKEKEEMKNLWEDIREMEADPSMTFRDNVDPNTITTWIANESDIKNDNVTVWKKIMDKAKMAFMLIYQRKFKTFQDLLRPVLEEYEKEHPGVRIKREGRLSLNNYNAPDIFKDFFKIETVEGYKTPRKRLIIPTDKEYKELAAKSSAKKAILDYMNSLVKEYFLAPDSMYNRKITTVEINGVEKQVSDMDLLLHSVSNSVVPYPGWFPKLSKSLDEIRYHAGNGNTLAGTFKKETLEYYFKTQLTDFIFDTYEGGTDTNSALPVKYLGTTDIEEKHNFTDNLEEAFDALIRYSEYKKQMDGVHALGKSMIHYLRMTEAKGNKEVYQNTIKFMETRLMSEVRKLKRLPDDALANWKVRIAGKEVPMDNMLRMLTNWASATVMWLRPVQGTMNGVHAKALTFREGAKGSLGKRLGFGGDNVDYTLQDLAFADGIYFGSYLKDSVLGNIKNNKMWLMAKHLNYLPENFDFFSTKDNLLTSRNNIFSSSNNYMFHTLPEEFISLIIMTAQLKHLKHPTLKDDHGNLKSIWDCYEVNEVEGGEGTIEWIGGIRGYQRKGKGGNFDLEKLEGLTSQEVAKLKKVYERMHGGYRKEEASMLEAYALGKSVVFLKKYFLRLVLNALQGRNSVTDLGNWKFVGKNKEGENIYDWIARKNTGKWKSVAMALGYVLTFKPSKFKILTAEEKLNFTEALLTLTMVIISGAAYSALFADSDDDDSAKKAWKMYLIDNFSQQYYPVDMLRTMSTAATPVAFARFVKTTLAGARLFYATAEWSAGSDAAFTKEGNLQGWVEFRKSIPYLSSYWDLKRRLERAKTVGDWLDAEYLMRK